MAIVLNLKNIFMFTFIEPMNFLRLIRIQIQIYDSFNVLLSN